jgi:hypothetical protein
LLRALAKHLVEKSHGTSSQSPTKGSATIVPVEARISRVRCAQRERNTAADHLSVA